MLSLSKCFTTRTALTRSLSLLLRIFFFFKFKRITLMYECWDQFVWRSSHSRSHAERSHSLFRVHIYNGKEAPEYSGIPLCESARNLRGEFNFHLLTDDNDISISRIFARGTAFLLRCVSGYITFPNEPLLIRHYPLAWCRRATLCTVAEGRGGMRISGGKQELCPVATWNCITGNRLSSGSG